MFYGSVPRKIAGLDQWECLGMGEWETNDEEVSVSFLWENDDILAPRFMAVSPAGEPGTINGF